MDRTTRNAQLIVLGVVASAWLFNGRPKVEVEVISTEPGLPVALLVDSELGFESRKEFTTPLRFSISGREATFSILPLLKDREVTVRIRARSWIGGSRSEHSGNYVHALHSLERSGARSRSFQEGYELRTLQDLWGGRLPTIRFGSGQSCSNPDALAALAARDQIRLAQICSDQPDGSGLDR